MNTPNSVRSIAELAQRNKVRIVGPHGAFELNSDGTDSSESADGLETIRQEIANRFLEQNASIVNVLACAASMTALIESLKSHYQQAVEQYEKAAKMSAELDERIQEFNDVMQRPVVPVYNREGKLIAAKRVAKK